MVEGVLLSSRISQVLCNSLLSLHVEITNEQALWQWIRYSFSLTSNMIAPGLLMYISKVE